MKFLRYKFCKNLPLFIPPKGIDNYIEYYVLATDIDFKERGHIHIKSLDEIFSSIYLHLIR